MPAPQQAHRQPAGVSQRLYMIKSINAGVKAELANYYVWEAFDRPIVVCLDPQAAERLQIAALTARFSGRELAEIGGVLLGESRMDGNRRITIIQDFRPVVRRNGHDPLYSLAEEDLAELEAALAPSTSGERRASPVGYYRSHNREGLHLSPGDLAIIHAYFPQPEAVFLVIKTLRTGACTAGIFLWDDGRIQPHFPCIEVPLAPVEAAPVALLNLRKADIDVSRAPALPQASGFDIFLTAPAEASGSAFEVRLFQPAAFQSSHWNGAPRTPAGVRQWRTIVALMMLVGAAVAAAIGVFMAPARRDAAPRPPSAFPLNVDRSADRLTLLWDRFTPDFLTADRAILRIQDGATRKAVPLDASQLRLGQTTYVASGDTVGFRLELYRDQKAISAGSIQVVLMSNRPQSTSPLRISGGLSR
jgi:hypothetical protein